MENRIEACIEFSFKGETYSLSSNLDLDQLVEHHDSLPSIYALLAKEHGIDTYSYLYEVMLEEKIEFRNARGIAADFMKNGDFDHQAFFTRLQTHKILALLQPIATRELNIADLAHHEALKKALLQAYHLGKEARSN